MLSNTVNQCIPNTTAQLLLWVQDTSHSMFVVRAEQPHNTLCLCEAATVPRKCHNGLIVKRPAHVQGVLQETVCTVRVQHELTYIFRRQTHMYSLWTG